MARGLKVPIGIDSTGGAAWVDGEANDNKTIKLALGDCDNENAFQQDLGLTSRMIFANNDEELRSSILRRLRTIFQEFMRQHRFKLLTNTISWVNGDSEGELVLEFKYLNLETDEQQTFRESFR